MKPCRPTSKMKRSSETAILLAVHSFKSSKICRPNLNLKRQSMASILCVVQEVYPYHTAKHHRQSRYPRRNRTLPFSWYSMTSSVNPSPQSLRHFKVLQLSSHLLIGEARSRSGVNNAIGRLFLHGLNLFGSTP